jgi:5-methylcytosine-specific restriction protein A
MTNHLPDGITRHHLLQALQELDDGATHLFAASTGFDVFHQGKRYAPKAVVGLAAERLTGMQFGPYDFKGGRGSKCFRVLMANGFSIITKGNTNPFPDEVGDDGAHVEGAVQKVLVNRFERNVKAREDAIRHHGLDCYVCGFNFQVAFGALGEGFIHVHHTVPISDLRIAYVVDPARDLVPVCPNCHSMLHKRTPPYSVSELKALMPGQKG